jgi:dihydrolipoamide dehydrogenase
VAAPYDFDLAIIGAGPGGYVAAIRAGQLGLKTAVVERDKPGGVCVNVGCIPSKALIHQANLYRSIPELEELGVRVDAGGLDYRKAFQKSRKAADTNSRGVSYLLKKYKAELIHAEAKINGRHELSLTGGGRLSASNLLIATGGRPRSIPGFEHDEEQVLSSTGAILLEELPKSLCILGGGVIGCEFAHLMNAFGVEVHIVEIMSQILPLEDEEVVKVLAGSFSKRGIKIRAATKAVSLKKGAGGVTLSVEGKGGPEKIEAEKILVVVGRTPNTDGIGLETLGIRTDRGLIPVQDYYQTAAPGVFAIGDVVAGPWLAHVASRTGEIAVEHLAGEHPRPAMVDLTCVPSVIYSEPQIASFGFTEKAARERGRKIKKGIFPYRGAGKAVATERTEGMVKIITDEETGEVLGAHVVGAEATEIIHELLLARSSELLPEDVTAMIHAHPTLSETVKEGMLAVEGRPIHV